MEDKRRNNKRVRLSGFSQLLIESCSIQPIHGFSCAYLEKHPFSLHAPSVPGTKFKEGSVEFIGHGCEPKSCVHGIARLVAWEIANGCLGISHLPVRFLRIIVAEDTFLLRSTPDYYYEIGVGFSHFITGGFHNDDGYSGKIWTKDMHDIMYFLSQAYGVTVNQYTATPQQNSYLKHDFPRVVERELEAQRQFARERLEKEKAWPQFEVGQMVRFTEEACQTSWMRRGIRAVAREPRPVLNVENVPRRCTCGLGDDDGAAPVALHPEMRCNLRRRSEMIHNQLVTVHLKDLLSDGDEGEMNPSGHYLEHV